MTDLAKFPSAGGAWSSGGPPSPPAASHSSRARLGAAGRARWRSGCSRTSGIMILTLRPGRHRGRGEPLPGGEGYRPDPDGAAGSRRRAVLHDIQRLRQDRIVRLTPRPPRPCRLIQPGLDVSPVGVAAARTGSTIYVFVRSHRRHRLLQAQHRQRPDAGAAGSAPVSPAQARRPSRRRRPGGSTCSPGTPATAPSIPGSSTASRPARTISAVSSSPRPPFRPWATARWTSSSATVRTAHHASTTTATLVTLAAARRRRSPPPLALRPTAAPTSPR